MPQCSAVQHQLQLAPRECRPWPHGSEADAAVMPIARRAGTRPPQHGMRRMHQCMHAGTAWCGVLLPLHAPRRSRLRDSRPSFSQNSFCRAERRSASGTACTHACSAGALRCGEVGGAWCLTAAGKAATTLPPSTRCVIMAGGSLPTVPGPDVVATAAWSSQLRHAQLPQLRGRQMHMCPGMPTPMCMHPAYLDAWRLVLRRPAHVDARRLVECAGRDPPRARSMPRAAALVHSHLSTAATWWAAIAAACVQPCGGLRFVRLINRGCFCKD